MVLKFVWFVFFSFVVFCVLEGASNTEVKFEYTILSDFFTFSLFNSIFLIIPIQEWIFLYRRRTLKLAGYIILYIIFLIEFHFVYQCEF